MDNSELPRLIETVLDGPTLERYLEDLSTVGEVVILAKGEAEGHSSDGPARLDTAMDQLLGGAVHSLQLRYAFDDKLWCDTLMRTDGTGLKLVRIELPRLS